MPDARSPSSSQAGAMSPPSTPSNYPFQPASKRPRLATEMTFPANPSQQQQTQSPQAQQQFVHSPQPQTPQPPPPASTAMLPPTSTSPIQQKTDTNDLQDVLHSTGIDLKAEEQALSDMLTVPNESFHGSFTQGGEQGSNSMDKSEEWDAVRQQRMVARQQAMDSHKTVHQNDPFLDQRSLRTALEGKCTANQLRVKVDPTEMEMLISLAMQDRIRDLLSSANRLALHRRDGNTINGLGDWTDMVVGESEKMDDAQTDGPLEPPDSAASPNLSNPRKRSFSVANPSNTLGPRKPKLISETARSLRALATAERSLEEARIAGRNQRLQKPGSLPQTPGAAADSPAGGAAAGSVAPELGERKMSAKESRKINQSKIDEANSHRAANSTASMMLGGLGIGKKKKYSWLNPAPSSSLPNSRPGTPVVNVSVATPRPAPVYWTRRMGEWNEQGERGQRIQIRDWVGALEGDGREKKTIIKAYLKMK